MIHPALLDSRRRRSGFTLIELLVVIMIIGILMGLLIPAISIVMARVNETRVASEIQVIGQSIANYTSQYGPLPSRVVLWEDGSFNTTSNATLSSMTWYGNPPAAATFSPTDLTIGQLDERSLTYLRKRFPKAQQLGYGIPGFTAGAVATPTNCYDFNGNGVCDANPILLEGHECLVFFLGGIPNRTATTIGMSGFSKFPQNPFINATNAPNRDQASDLDFSKMAGRLFDDDGDGIPGLVDPLGNGTDQRYYAYFSAYGGGNYDPNDENFAITNPDENFNGTPFIGTFRVNFVVGGVTNVINSPGPNPYTSSPAVPLPLIGGGPAVYHAAQSYQLFSAGRDKIFGMGGEFLPDATGEKLMPPAPLPPNAREVEDDNITSFSSGRLE